MNILLAGQKWFGAEVFRAFNGLKELRVVAIAAPVGGEKVDRLTALADIHEVPLIPAGTLNARTMPPGVDLIVAAHSHDFIGEKTRLRATHGGVGYHPSLLPIHRGRDAIRWTLRARERVTGGSVYRLSNRMDGGNILAQEHVFVHPDDDAEELWREKLCPLGVKLLTRVALKFAREGYQDGEPQDESLATWEPSIDRPPAFRPDLILLPWGNYGRETEDETACAS